MKTCEYLHDVHDGQSFLKAEKEMRVEMQRFIVTFPPTLLLFFWHKTFITHFLHFFNISTIKTANSVFQKSLHTARLLIFSAYFQKYEIFVYESAKQAMDETFFSNLGLNV